MRCETILEKGVRTTIGMSGWVIFTSLAQLKGLILSPLGMEMMSSYVLSFSA